jgi:hypothetical protein
MQLVDTVEDTLSMLCKAIKDEPMVLSEYRIRDILSRMKINKDVLQEVLLILTHTHPPVFKPYVDALNIIASSILEGKGIIPLCTESILCGNTITATFKDKKPGKWIASVKQSLIDQAHIYNSVGIEFTKEMALSFLKNRSVEELARTEEIYMPVDINDSKLNKLNKLEKKLEKNSEQDQSHYDEFVKLKSEVKELSSKVKTEFKRTLLGKIFFRKDK